MVIICFIILRHYLINNPEFKVVFVSNKEKSENNESVMLLTCYVRLPKCLFFPQTGFFNYELFDFWQRM